jgi:hypothetical protein
MYYKPAVSSIYTGVGTWLLKVKPKKIEEGGN